MSNSQEILHNIELLLDKLGELSDKKLLLVYWQQIDNVKMDKEVISTKDFLSKATDAELILNSRKMLDIMKSEKLLDD